AERREHPRGDGTQAQRVLPGGRAAGLVRGPRPADGEGLHFARHRAPIDRRAGAGRRRGPAGAVLAGSGHLHTDATPGYRPPGLPEEAGVGPKASEETTSALNRAVVNDAHQAPAWRFLSKARIVSGIPAPRAAPPAMRIAQTGESTAK